MRTTGVWMDGEDMVERRSQDVEPILEHNQALRSVHAYGSSDMRHAAKIPTSVIETYMAVNGVDFPEFMGNEVHMRNILNDPALKNLRIWPGRV